MCIMVVMPKVDFSETFQNIPRTALKQKWHPRCGDEITRGWQFATTDVNRLKLCTNSGEPRNVPDGNSYLADQIVTVAVRVLSVPNNTCYT
jgi:hypothetical protein